MINWLEASDTETVCYCVGVNKGTIVNAIKSGDKTLGDLKISTKACTGRQCKTMHPEKRCCSTDINELIKLYSKESI